MKFNRERAMLPLVLLTIVLGVVVGTQYRNAQTELGIAKREYVYQICNNARQEDNGASELECGRAQERTSTEFLCEQRNQYPDNVCWVEEK